MYGYHSDRSDIGGRYHHFQLQANQLQASSALRFVRLPTFIGLEVRVLVVS
jgi:hypothetical protein